MNDANKDANDANMKRDKWRLIEISRDKWR